MLLDLISLLVMVAIVGGLVVALRPSLLDPVRRPTRREAPVSPRSFAMSGGYGPRPATRPAPAAQEEPSLRRRPPRPPAPDHAAEPTAEERPRVAPTPAMAPVRRSSGRAMHLRRQLADPATLQTALVLREVLDRPLALREPSRGS